MSKNNAARTLDSVTPLPVRGTKPFLVSSQHKNYAAPGALGSALKNAQNAVSQAFHAIISAYQLTPIHFSILMLIHENKGLSQSELGNAMQIDRSTMVSIIDKLEKNNMVVRAPSAYDRRSYALELSEEGNALLEKLLPEVIKKEQEIASRLEPEEFEQLLDLLQKIAA